MIIGSWNPHKHSWSCATCAWLSPDETKCFNPYYIAQCKHNSLPVRADMYGCPRYENKETRLKILKDESNLKIV